MILGALDDVGGQAYLMRQAEENPTAFLTLIGKVLPTTLAGDPANPLRVTSRIELVPVEPEPREYWRCDAADARYGATGRLLAPTTRAAREAPDRPDRGPASAIELGGSVERLQKPLCLGR